MAASVGYLNAAQNTVGTNAVLSGQRVVDMDDTIHLLEPDANPLTVLMKALGNSVPTDNPEYNWLEDALQARTVTIDGTGQDSSTTSVGVTTNDGKKVAKYDLIKVPSTGEIFRVTSISTDTLTITRGFGTTAGAAIPAGEIVLIMGNAFAENATQGSVLATQTVKKTNYTQIFRTHFGFSRTLQDSKLYGGDYKAYQSRKHGIEHQIKQEEQFLFGEPKEDSTNAIRATGGVDYWISTNEQDVGGGLSYGALVSWAQRVSRYGNQTQRLCIAAPVVCTAVDMMAQARLFHMTEARVFGVKLNRITTSHIDFYLKKAVLLSETTAYNERMYTLDVDTLRRRPLAGSDTKLKQNIQANDADGELHEYLTEVGFQMHNEEASGVLTGITGAA